MSNIRITHRDAVFGQTVVQLRQSRGLEQGELAQRAGISRAALSRIERGESSATISTMSEIAVGLNMSIVGLIEQYTKSEDALSAESVKIVPKAEAKSSGAALAIVGLSALAVLLAKK